MGEMYLVGLVLSEAVLVLVIGDSARVLERGFFEPAPETAIEGVRFEYPSAIKQIKEVMR